MKVKILLSSYNGQAYINEQIESIRNQSFQDWQLLIRDDGSTDGTVAIIEDYCRRDSRIHFINSDDRTNCGVIESFYHLLKHEEADYYFFSDQDDVWLENKLAICLDRAKEEKTETPILVYTDLKVVDENLKVINESMIRSQSHHANTELVQELTENTVTGGTMMINHALAQTWHADSLDNIIMHDWYLALLAAALGKLIYIDQPTQLYRQHGNNVLGARTWRKRMGNWLRPHRLIEKYWLLIKSSQNQANNIVNLIADSEKSRLVLSYVYLLDNNFINRIKLIERNNFRKNRKFHTLVFKGLLITKIGYRREKNEFIQQRK